MFSAEEMVCTHTLYNEERAGNLPLGVMELPEAIKRKKHKGSEPRENKKKFGKSIDLRLEIASSRIEEGHWEGEPWSASVPVRSLSCSLWWRRKRKTTLLF